MLWMVMSKIQMSMWMLMQYSVTSASSRVYVCDVMKGQKEKRLGIWKRIRLGLSWVLKILVEVISVKYPLWEMR